jgi:acetyl-CoA carboxylase, biotin carboxylase subunit
MNARIQVEHGVTEMLCGVDLVCEQLRVAAGLPLSVAQEDVVARGCAIELRINAEDPEQKFMPSPGEITGWHAPSGPGVRVDAGVETGRKVVPYYDSMVAKVMVWGADREQALARARRALDELTVEGIKTTRDLQRSLLDWDEFVEGRATTESLESYLGAAA